MNINEIFGGRKLTKKQRKEQKQRELERLRVKAEIASSITDRKSKLKMVKAYENNPAFQKDLWRMKKMLIKPELKPTKPIVKDGYNMMNPGNNFLKSETDMELKGFDKQFKKKKDFFGL